MVPSLVSCCLRALIPYSDQVALPVPLRLRPHDPLLDNLVPDPGDIDPKLWAVLIQIYDALPPLFSNRTLPLVDSHLPLLQSLSPTPHFSLITLLNLSACSDLTDESILLFKSLHTLVAFDASNTAISSYAISTLAAILQRTYDPDAVRTHRGPWELRILSLRNCKQVTNDIYPYLQKFPLLSVVDLRGTQCTPPTSSLFSSCTVDTFHHPTSLSGVLKGLQLVQPNLTISRQPYILNIDKLQAPVPKNRVKHVPSVGPQNAFVVIPANPARPIKVGNIHVLERQKQEHEEHERHEINKEAWYARQEHIEKREMDMHSDWDSGSESDSTDVDHEFRAKYRKRERDLAAFIKSSFGHSNNSTKTRRPSALPSTLSRIGGVVAHVQNVATSASTNSLSAKMPRLPMPTAGLELSSVPEHRRPTRLKRATLQLPSPANDNWPQADAASARPLQNGRLAHSTSRYVGPEHCRATQLRSLPNPPVAPPPSEMAGPSVTADRVSTSALKFYQPRPTRTTIYDLKKRIKKASDDDEGDPALRLYRDPPPYSYLSAVLNHSLAAIPWIDNLKPSDCVGKDVQGEKTKTGSLPIKAGLDEMAVVDQTSMRAERARNAMKLAAENRMSSLTSSSSSSYSRDVFGGGMAASEQGHMEHIGSALNKRRHAVPSFESSFSSDVSSDFATTGSNVNLSASRNPFRKRASLPTRSSTMSGFFEPPVFDAPAVSTSLPTKEIRSADIDASSTRLKLKTTLLGTSSFNAARKPISRSSSVCNLKRASSSASVSSAATNASILMASTSTSMPISRKPLIPISAVKVPILPDDVRRAALAREREEIPRANGGAKKKRKVYHSDGEDEDDASSDDKDRSLKRRSSLGVSASSSSVSTTAAKPVQRAGSLKTPAKSGGNPKASKEKGKGKTVAGKKSSFDWNGWSKK